MSKIKCHIKLNYKLAMSASLAFWTLSRRQPRGLRAPGPTSATLSIILGGGNNSQHKRITQ